MCNFLPVDCLFPFKHSRKIVWKSEPFPQKYRRNIKENVSGCFFSEHSVVVIFSQACSKYILKYLPDMVVPVAYLAGRCRLCLAQDRLFDVP